MGCDLDMDTLIAVISALGIGVTFWVVGLMLTGAAGGRRYQRRLNSLQERAQGIATSEWAVARSLSRQQSGTRIDRIAGNRLPRRDLLLARLDRTGRAISIGKSAMTAIGLGAVSAIGLAGGTGIGIVPSLVTGLLIGTAVPHLVIGRMGKRRLARFINLFPDAIDLVVRALRSGLPVTEAIVGAGHEIADPVGAEFRLIESGMRMGRDLESLLWETAKRIDASEFRFFVIALSVQRETGGNLAETLSNLADILRRRKQMKAKAHAMASETRATTMILGGLPVAVIFVLMLTSPAYLTPLFNDVRGLVLDAIAVTMLLTGIVIMNKMAKFQI